MSSNSSDKTDLQHLTELVQLMIEHDLNSGQAQHQPADDLKLVRDLPLICPGHTNAKSVALKAELVRQREASAAPKDDPYLLRLESIYKGILFFDYEDAMATYRCDCISYIPNNQDQNLNPPAWEATCVEVIKRETGKWGPKPGDYVANENGKEVVKPRSYVGYTLAELFDPDNPTPRNWVDQYSARHAKLAAEDEQYGEAGWYKNYKDSLRSQKRKWASFSTSNARKKMKE